MDEGLAAVLGAGVTGVVALLIPIANNEFAFARERRLNAAKRVDAYLSATYDSVIAIGDLARAPMADKGQAEQLAKESRLDRHNSALTSILNRDDQRTRDAAQALDAAITELTRLARAQHYDRLNWQVERRVTVDLQVQAMQAVARAVARRSERRWYNRR